MPDLGKYAFDVLASYGASLLLLGGLLALTLARGAKVRQDMHKMEQRSKSRG